MHPTRRTLCRSLLAAPLLLPMRPATAAAEPDLEALERRIGGRIGVAAGSVDRVLLQHRADTRFPMCSTFKVLAAAAVLARVDAGSEQLDAPVPYRADALLSYAPVTRKALETQGGAGRLSVAELCAAALEWSDNTAANLLLARLGGPEGLTVWLRNTGDPVTRLDRDEPTLNTAIPGDPRDTTTPEAMRATLGRILLGTVLAPPSRARLEGWMVGSQTGFKRLRAGLPKNWTVGDKTGTGDKGTFNDVAILRPPGRAPVTVAVYITGSTLPVEAVDSVHAEIGRLIAARIVAA
ncbi:class A beta-lactamase [Methylobacterium sp. E-065]|uniref:class A beta-lactamase n=1 Tax=Methylobacterium sp. E-065 TaxID=2836583 RepID=UPI001FB8788B|nr:class A beta-lactamase [Methylobacterium sp. E-065]MCJ2019778.1 class A beta-lactamase [Methylobacterium sp. E-065]